MPPFRRRAFSARRGARRAGFKRRRGFSRRRPSIVRRINRAASATGVGTIMVNPGRLPSTTMTKTLFGYGGVQVGALSNIALNMVFDPSGTYDTNMVACPDWNNITQCYNMYKVKKIIMNVTCAGSSLGNDSVVIYGRYYYDAAAPGVNLAFFQERQNVKMHTFSPEHPMARWEIIPMVGIDTRNTGLLASAGVTWKRMPWTDKSYPAQIYGWASFVPSLPAGLSLSYDLTYVIKFKNTR